MMTDIIDNKNTKNTPDQKPQKEDVAVQSMPLHIHTQYVKDISFENPNAPHSFRLAPGEKPQQPEMDININLESREIKDPTASDLYEVVLILQVNAKNKNSHDNGKTVFLAEIQYGVLASLAGVPKEQHHPVLLIELPRIVFPYARQILSDLTAAGGYPPLMLNPIDFQAMYLDRFGKKDA